jgi:diguanylate cyclase (GGDEF)-like protein
MKHLSLSVHARLTIFIAALVAIVVTLSVVAATRLLAIDHKVEALDGTLLASTDVLGELSDRITEFRLAETYRALAHDARSRATAEVLADGHRYVISKLQAQYLRLNSGNTVQLALFTAAWHAYLAEHDAWVRSDSNGNFDDQAQFASSLHRLYRAADLTIDQLSDANTSAAHAEANAVDDLVDKTILILLTVSAAGILLAIWLLIRVRVNITRPLAAITQALTSLSAGDRTVQVPELDRNDEIGAMAKAFDVFRANAVALEEATAATRLAQEQAQALARHDPLTGLPNRRVFSAELESALNHTRNEGAVTCVLMIDLDRFKPVNDLQGHAVGDLVLCEVAARLQGIVGQKDKVARLGGDEFAIIFETEPQEYPDAVIRLASKTLAAIQEPVTVGSNTIEIGASIGIASAPGDGQEPDTLLHAADIAMYRAKQDGRAKFCFYERRMDQELHAQAQLESDLKSAVSEGKIQPYYQPLIDMQDKHIYGFEMLARWQHPERGFVPPDIFIPLAEQLGLIPDLTWSMLRQACRDSRQWPDHILLSINISPNQLKEPALPAQLLAILTQENFPPSRLEIEITETALVSDIETAKMILTALQSVGIKISLDDFGTGYSSLYHLRELRFDKIKIDRSFVQSMEDNRESEKIVDAILSLAKSLGLPTVAEGIENTDVVRHLVDMGCEFGQGYYFGKAMTAQDAARMLEAGAEKQKAL